MKVLFQGICKSKINWYNELSQELKVRWFKIIKDISDKSYFEISCPYVNIDDDKSVKIYELHHFSVANPKAYGACVYLQMIKLSGEINVKLAAAKSHVSPLNTHTIPRTELLGNLLLVCLMNSVKKALESQVTILDQFYWTNLIVCLWWTKAFDKEYKTFVQNRLHEICELSNIEEWNYVKTNSNPTNMVTKFSTDLFRLNSFWWEGPQFLKEKNAQNIFYRDILFKDKSTELKTTAVNIATSNVYSISHIININSFSSFTKLMRVMPWVKGYVNNLKAKAFNETDIKK